MTTDDRLNAADDALRAVGIMGATDLVLEEVAAAALDGDRTRLDRIALLGELLDVPRGTATKVLDLIREALG